MKRKRESFTIIILVVCFILLSVVQSMQTASALGKPMVIVSNITQLQTEINNASDGDIIGISGTLTIYADNTLLGSTDKHITLKRMTVDSKISMIEEYNFSLIQNITFDGNNISSQYPFISINHKPTFENVTFENFISTTPGGVINISSGEATFNSCKFENNSGSDGGHIALKDSSIVNVNNSILKNGHATGKGGAIYNGSTGSTVNIKSSIITENNANDLGGGILNYGAVSIEETKLYNNTSNIGGSDIANIGWANAYMNDTIEDLVVLFTDEYILPTGWASDYTDATGNQYNTKYLRLEYEIIPTEIILDSASLGTSADSKITGLESGKYYNVTMGDIISYSKADGTLTQNELDAEPLIGTEIIGLTNGETYKVEEYIIPIEEPTEVTLAPSSLGTAGDEKITGLETGKYYKITVEDVTSFSKSDGNLTSNETESGKLTRTEVIGLINGQTYLVEEYTPAPIDEEPVDETPNETPNEEEPKTPIIITTSSSITTNTTTTNNSTDNSSRETSDSSKTTNTEDSNNTSTVNHYYSGDHSTKYTTENVIPSNENDEKVIVIKEAASPAPVINVITGDEKNETKTTPQPQQKQNININANNIDLVFKQDENGYTIDINKASNDEEVAEPVFAYADGMVNSDTESKTNIPWIEIIKICLLGGIFICLLKRPSTKID